MFAYFETRLRGIPDTNTRFSAAVLFTPPHSKPTQYPAFVPH